jgi:hypothetical protein
LEIENKKSDTRVDAQFNQEEKTIMLKLTDVTNNPIGEASLKITDNNNQKTVSTDNQGIVNIAMDEGSHNVSIQYEGNETFNPSETTINVITEDDNTNESVKNNTINDTNINQNNTENITITDAHDANNTTITNDILQNDSTNATQNNTAMDENTKIKTTLKSEVVKENSTLVINLTTEDDKAISNEYIKIKLDNGTEITKKTDQNGIIILDLDDYSSIDQMEFEFLGDEDYSSSDDFITI